MAIQDRYPVIGCRHEIPREHSDVGNTEYPHPVTLHLWAAQPHEDHNPLAPNAGAMLNNRLPFA